MRTSKSALGNRFGTICRSRGYRRLVQDLRIPGHWLQRAGFDRGQHYEIEFGRAATCGWPPRGVADVQVIPSRYEPFGMVVLEGMRHGLPIVATKLGGPAVILEHGRTGLLVPAWDSGALAAAILRLVRSPGLRRRLGAAAAGEVRRNWLWPRIAKRMQSVYRETLAGTSAAA